MQHLKIKIYTSPGCPHCRAAKEFFRSYGIKFKEIDITKNPKEADRIYKKAKIMATPIIEIGNRIIVGFDRAKIKKMVGIP